MSTASPVTSPDAVSSVTVRPSEQQRGRYASMIAAGPCRSSSLSQWSNRSRTCSRRASRSTPSTFAAEARSIARCRTSSGGPVTNATLMPHPTITARPLVVVVASARIPASLRSAPDSSIASTSFGHFSAVFTPVVFRIASTTLMPMTRGNTLVCAASGRSKIENNSDRPGSSTHVRPWRPRPAV